MAISNDLHYKQLQKLFKMFCVHKKEYKTDEYFPDVWQDCKSCILCEIPWQILGEISEIQGAITRDLCFAIWHEEILAC